MTFRQELQALGASEFQIVALSLDEKRGRAAVDTASQRGVEHVVSYAIKLFDDSTFSAETGPSRPRLATNVFADVKCETCDGHRMVLVSDDPHTLYGETWAPCAQCNADCETTFWRVDGTRLKALPR